MLTVKWHFNAERTLHKYHEPKMTQHL